MSELEFHIRPAGASDIPYIGASWFDSYRESPLARSLRPSIYKHYHSVISHLLNRSSAFVAHDPGNHDHLIGFLVYEPGFEPVVHYVYTRNKERYGEGLASALLSAAGLAEHRFIYTHRTTDSQRITTGWEARDGHGPIYDPTRLFVGASNG
jgi:hypothetical protein